MKYTALMVALLLVAFGCSHMKKAREAQMMLSPIGAEVVTDEDESANVSDETNAQTNVTTFTAVPVVLEGMHLADYVEFAFSNRSEVLQAELDIERADLAIEQASSGYYPQVGVSGGYNRSTMNARPRRHFDSHMNGDPSGSLNVDLLICDFGRLAAKVRAARQERIAAEAAYLRTRYDVFGEVCDAYFNLLKCDALLEAAYTNEYQYAQHLDEAQTLFEAEEAKKLDVLKAKLDLSNARLATADASNNVVKAVATFVAALGITGDMTTRMDLLAPRTNCLQIASRDLEETTMNGIDAFDRARDSAPELALRRAQFRAANFEVDYAYADLYPEITLSSSLGFVDRVWNFSWGASVVQSIFNGFRKTSALDMAVVAMKRAAAEVLKEEQLVSESITKAVAERDNARDMLHTAQVKVFQAKENLDTCNAQYRAGDISRLDYTDAVQQYVSALSERIGAFYDGQRAEAKLVTCIGIAPAYVEQSVDFVKGK